MSDLNLMESLLTSLDNAVSELCNAYITSPKGRVSTTAYRN